MRDDGLISMSENDIAEAVELIRISMNEDEAFWARETMAFHFNAQKHQLHDGRSYFIWKESGRIVGLTGLHHYNWGPKINVWLGWFAVSPEYQGAGLGKILLENTIEIAISMGFEKMFIETYSQKTFQAARRFYEANGFKHIGTIRNYLTDSSDMMVYMKKVV